MLMLMVSAAAVVSIFVPIVLPKLAIVPENTTATAAIVAVVTERNIVKATDIREDFEAVGTLYTDCPQCYSILASFLSRNRRQV